MPLYTRNILIALAIALLITGTVAYAITYLNNARVRELSELESQLAINTLSIDTQFSLLEAAPCNATKQKNGLSSELADLGARLSFTENQLGSDNRQVLRLH